MIGQSFLERIVRALFGVMTLATFAVLYLPVFVNGLFSLVPADRDGFRWSEASFRWYWQLFENESVVDAIVTTVYVGIVSVSAAIFLSVVLALYVEWERAIFRRTIEFVIYVPFVMPPIITGLSLLVFFDGIGISRGEATIVVGHAALVLAVLYRLVLTRLRSIPRSALEASFDLGASRFQTFRYVIWAHIRPALVTGAVLAMAISFDETLITMFLSGDTTTLPLRLWAMMRLGFGQEINALVTLVLVVSIVLAVLTAIRLRTDRT